MTEREGERDFEDLAQTIVELVKSNICSVGQRLREELQSSPKVFCWKNSFSFWGG